MPIIQKLSDSTINLIAEGEVIANPASVVKELIENSIDAGATKIEIWFENGGKTLVVVKHNGAGMSHCDYSPASLSRGGSPSALSELRLHRHRCHGPRQLR